MAEKRPSINLETQAKYYLFMLIIKTAYLHNDVDDVKSSGL